MIRQYILNRKLQVHTQGDPKPYDSGRWSLSATLTKVQRKGTGIGADTIILHTGNF